MESPIAPSPNDESPESAQPACVLVFNASDPSGAGGLSADITAMASVGAHAVPVVTGAYTRDTADIFGHFAFDDEAVAEQARAVLEDVSVQLIKVGFVGTPENLGVIAGISADYADVPVIAYMPNLAWWDEVQIDIYLDAFKELILPQTSVLVGNHSTLWRWLLPDWSMERPPGARDIARAAEELGVPYTFVTGIPLPDQFIDNVLTSAQAVMASEKFERFEAVFSGAGDTLSAAFSALIASGCDMTEAFSEALSYLDHSLEAGFRPGMGHIVPDRLFWAQPEDDEDTERVEGDPATSISFLDHTPNDTKH
ncbi:bifunctional hydroxymethylpyrimidine kinase/phosphomethylpyrimidine kinase [Rhodoferax sp. PAMC 29310]|uniref:bifunctional hydroxymethylpyrimidine kinase/phosphomethylpyrimidine kinase n=1 Tax=Rhodoferax sp. PAMC 29310 TaxID=2822760 RepID=UPI001B328C14|nr:bifunctional hydroxymethylpyrimidine kinase/phosphomethylpyrimidine kinase [Rhodoferax sp. PAMC 29310]